MMSIVKDLQSRGIIDLLKDTWAQQDAVDLHPQGSSLLLLRHWSIKGDIHTTTFSFKKQFLKVTCYVKITFSVFVKCLFS